MAQHDYVIANASGATVRADINSALSAIQTLNSGTSEPSSTASGMLWLDTTGGAPYALKVRDAGNNHWLTLASVTDPGSDGNIETSATIKGTIDSTATMPAGTVLQVLTVVSQVQKTTTNAETWTGLNQSITLKSTNPKILLIYSHNAHVSTQDNAFEIHLTRDTSAITASNLGTKLHSSGFVAYAGHTTFNATYTYQYLDTLSATQGSTLYYGTTFSLDFNGQGAPTFYINYTDANIDPTSSSLTVMEIKS
jgi:hypothetical protein